MNEVEENLKETDSKKRKFLLLTIKKIIAVKPNEPTELTFWDHLDALRQTIIHIACAVVALMLLAFCFKDELFGVILAPKEGNFCTYRFSHGWDKCFIFPVWKRRHFRSNSSIPSSPDSSSPT